MRSCDLSDGVNIGPARCQAQGRTLSEPEPKDTETGRPLDVAVVGAGIVGLGAALALAQRGLRVALLERVAPEPVRNALGFDPRTVALAPPAVALLKRLGVWEEADAAAIDRMQVWEEEGTAALHFGDGETLAHVVENSALVERMWNAAEKCVEVRCPFRVTDYTELAESAALSGEGTDTPGVAARLVLAADGASGGIGELAGARMRRSRPVQHAIVSVVQCRREHEGAALQRFGADGSVLALLPLTDPCHRALIWSLATSRQEAAMAWDDDAFYRALNDETEAAAGIRGVGPRFAFPLRQGLASDINPSQRLLVLGDAARTLHPMAGQGVNIGLEDVRALLARLPAGDLAPPGAWRRFAADRRARSKLMLGLNAALLAAYGARAPLARAVRNMGVRFLNGNSIIKAQLVREAMGVGALTTVGFDRPGGVQ
ncbi:MAG: FAD-dependent oxidoreductase [Gammaproteobacteria bacterium]|nr:FAD-dependent oxidoreductase [Gammaproteobacteria bacterium]MYB36566.1 FAD-dependent oxidoreductase [Gammaproteobacteria bacterium]